MDFLFQTHRNPTLFAFNSELAAPARARDQLSIASYH